MRRSEAKKEATRLARGLIELAVATAPHDLELAKRQASLARRLILKFNIRFGYGLRRFYCHGCKELIVPGINARARLHGGMVLLTCKDCGRVNRKRLRKARLNIQR